MSKETFRVGVIGAGNIATAAHLPAWRKIPGVTIVGIADLDLERAQAAARTFSIPHAAADAESLFDLGLDAVDLCVPNRAHSGVAVEALELGLAVLCEKPLAPTVAEVRQMGKLADEKGALLMTGQHQRFTAGAQALWRWSRREGGGIGSPYHARVRAMRRSRVPTAPGFIDASLSGGGPALDIGVHALDLCLWLLGFPEPERVSGSMGVHFGHGWEIPGEWGEWDRRRFTVEDFAAGFVHFKHGISLVFEAAWLGHQREAEELSCEVFGLKGSARWPSCDFATVEAGSYIRGTIENPQHAINPYDAEIRAFYDAVRLGRPSPVPWRETEKVIAILEALQHSQRERREILLQ